MGQAGGRRWRARKGGAQGRVEVSKKGKGQAGGKADGGKTEEGEKVERREGERVKSWGGRIKIDKQVQILVHKHSEDGRMEERWKDERRMGW